MIADNLETAVDRLRELVADASMILPFTGAGISTECGIPDFRSPGGFWARNKPIQFEDFLNSREMRDESWRRRFVMEDSFGGAKPGRGHRALASLYKAGKTPAVVTQNIDNLHQVSGFAAGDVVELHGNTSYATCLDCGIRYELETVRARFDVNGGHAPDCDCGGFIKTATVSFGQAMPGEAMRRAEESVTVTSTITVPGVFGRTRPASRAKVIEPRVAWPHMGRQPEVSMNSSARSASSLTGG